MTEREIDNHNLAASFFQDRDQILLTRQNAPRHFLHMQIIDWPELPNSLIGRVCGCAPEEVEAERIRIYRADRLLGVDRSRRKCLLRLRKQRARAAKKARIPNDLRWTVWRRDNFTCQHCGARKNLSIDHIIPESEGGEMTLANLWTLCKPCNSEKGTKIYAYPTEVKTND